MQALFLGSLRSDGEDPTPRDTGSIPSSLSWFCRPVNAVSSLASEVGSSVDSALQRTGLLALASLGDLGPRKCPPEVESRTSQSSEQGPWNRRALAHSPGTHWPEEKPALGEPIGMRASGLLTTPSPGKLWCLTFSHSIVHEPLRKFSLNAQAPLFPGHLQGPRHVPKLALEAFP